MILLPKGHKKADRQNRTGKQTEYEETLAFFDGKFETG